MGELHRQQLLHRLGRPPGERGQVGWPLATWGTEACSPAACPPRASRPLGEGEAPGPPTCGGAQAPEYPEQLVYLRVPREQGPPGHLDRW